MNGPPTVLNPSSLATVIREYPHLIHTNFTKFSSLGYGHHADYVFGWKGDALQKAMDANCQFNCPQLKTQAYAPANACTQRPRVQEDQGTGGWLKELPGAVAVTK